MHIFSSMGEALQNFPLRILASQLTWSLQGLSRQPYFCKFMDVTLILYPKDTILKHEFPPSGSFSLLIPSAMTVHDT